MDVITSFIISSAALSSRTVFIGCSRADDLGRYDFQVTLFVAISSEILFSVHTGSLNIQQLLPTCRIAWTDKVAPQLPAAFAAGCGEGHGITAITFVERVDRQHARRRSRAVGLIEQAALDLRRWQEIEQHHARLFLHE